MNLLKTLTTKNALYATVLLYLVWSCDSPLSTDYQLGNIESSPTMAFPLAYGDLSIQDILSKQDSAFIKVDEDGLIYLEYSQTLRTQAIKDLITLPDKEGVSNDIPVPLAGVVGPFPSDINSTEVSDIVFFDITPEELTEVLLKGGTIDYDVTLTPPNPDFEYEVRVSIAELVSQDNNMPFTAQLSGSGSISLDNYLYSSSVPNRMVINYRLVIKENPNSFAIMPGTTVRIGLSFRDLEFRYAKGYFSRQVADVPADTITIEAFGHSLINQGTVSFADPEVKFVVTNDAGIPVRLDFASLGVEKPEGTTPMLINPTNPVIPAPLVMGQEEVVEVTVENENAFMDLSATKLYYKVAAYLNEPDTLATNFITDTSSLKVNMSVKIPFYGYISTISLRDTFAIDINDIDESTIESGALKLKVTNEIPLEVNIQFYLADENYQILDSLITPAQPVLLESSVVNAAGDLQSPGSSDALIQIDNAKLNKILDSRNIIVKAQMNTAKDANGNFFPVKFRAHYKIDIKLGFQAKLKVKVEL